MAYPFLGLIRSNVRNKKWHSNRPDETKELSLYRGKKLSIRLTVTRHYPVKISPVRGARFGISVRKIKRSRLERLRFWFLRRKFKELTTKELKKLSVRDQKEYLDRKYYFYGIVPYLKANVTEL